MYMRRKIDFLVRQHIKCFNISKKLHSPAYENNAEALDVAQTVDWLSKYYGRYTTRLSLLERGKSPWIDNVRPG
jgi:hypothetical protein